MDTQPADSTAIRNVPTFKHRIKAMNDHGVTPMEIATVLNKEGFVTPHRGKKWNKKYVKNHIGLIKRNGVKAIYKGETGRVKKQGRRKKRVTTTITTKSSRFTDMGDFISWVWTTKFFTSNQKKVITMALVRG